MGAVKISKFFGRAPKISPELLPDTVAQSCYNAKLYSGDLIPYYQSSVDGVLTKGGTIQTIYPMVGGSGQNVWLHWTEDVDVARAQITNDTTQRLYYTGQSEPRVTNYNLATNTGATTVGALPLAYYTLGLPTPLTAITAAASGFSTLTTSSRARDAGNIATIVTSTAHGLRTGAYVTVTSLAGTGYNLSNVQVTVVNSTTFTYYSTGSSEGTTADTAGRVDLAGTTQSRTYVYTWMTTWGEESTPSPVSSTVYVKEGQTVSLTALPAAWPGSYTGTYQTTGMVVRIYRTVASTAGTTYYKIGEVPLGTTTFTDDVDVRTLATPLASTDYDQPAAAMTGLLAVHNGIMVGFYGNTLCFCEPGYPHAWPLKYRIQLDSDIVAVGNFGTSIIVATKGNPWLVQGAHPANMSKVRMDYVLPCVSKRSMVNMGYGVAWASRNGLALYSSQTGGTALTMYVHDWDTWRDNLDPTTLVGKFYNGKYFGCHSQGSFTFEKNDQVGGYLVDVTQMWSAGYYDKTAAKFYYAYGGSVSFWDDPTQLLMSADWKSKVIVTKDYLNLGAARVIADFGYNANDIAIASQNAVILAQNQSYVSSPLTAGGGIGGAPAGVVPVAGSRIRNLLAANSGVQFQLFANKQLVFTTQLSSSDIFRLPTGYRTDTYEVRVVGNIRVRAIHLGETPFGLKQV